MARLNGSRRSCTVISDGVVQVKSMVTLYCVRALMSNQLTGLYKLKQVKEEESPNLFE